MYKRLAYVVGIGLAVLAAVDSQAQSSADTKKHDRAQELESQGSHNEAVVLYRELLESQPENVTYHYELGLIYTQKLGNGSDAIPLWEKVAADDAPRNRSDGQFYLGRSYQLINRFDEAIAAYRKFGDLARLESSYNPRLNDYNRLIAQCDFAKGSTPDKGVEIMNLGEGVNTTYPEYIPVVDRADSVLLYTSRRKTNTGGKIDRDDQQYYEDMYVSYSDKGNYGTGALYDGSNEFLGIILNTDKHESVVAYTTDQQQLITYRDNKLWISTVDGDQLRRAQVLPEEVNRGDYQPHATITADGNTIYFSRSEGADKDLFKVTRDADGNWGKSESLGAPLNTVYEEDSPVISPDGQVLYFASTGHDGFGGYDIFRSKWQGDSWGEPENMGSPINSSGHDIYFSPHPGGSIAYFASNRPGGYGDMDIYRAVIRKPFDGELPYLETSTPELAINMAFTDTIRAGDQVTLDARSSVIKGERITNYYWQVQDRLVRDSTVINHTYQQPGTYDIELEVLSEDSNGVVKPYRIKRKIVVLDDQNYLAYEESRPSEAEKYKDLIRELRQRLRDEQDSLNAIAVVKDPGQEQPTAVAATTATTTTTDDGTALAAATPAPQTGTAAVAPATTNPTGTTTIAATSVGEATTTASGSSSDQPVAAASKPVEDDLPELGDAFGLENVLFAFDKSRLGRVVFATMMRNYEALKAHPDAYIIVSAHTDSRGTNNYNQGLSERRAKTVVEFLVSRGIDRKRIYEIETHGETRLTNDCGDEASCAEALHKLNRRVELVVVNKVKASS